MSAAMKDFLMRLGLIALMTFIIVRVFYLFFSQQGLKTSHITSSRPLVAVKPTVPQAIIAKPTAMERVFPNKTSQAPKASKRKSKGFEWDNSLRRTSMRWGDFVQLPQQTVRNRVNIPNSVLSSMKQCTSTVSNGSKVCMNVWNDRYINIWKSRRVKDLCEANANSRITCFDSPQPKSRYCVMENAMMNFRKVRRRKAEGGQGVTRSWEKGFLSADCGDMAPEDIGYLGLYKPDIDGRDDAVCDFVFNETVLAYSHENSRSLYAMVNDYMNLWTTLWLSGSARFSKDVTLLNIDGIKKSKYYADVPNQFFKVYNASFRRVIKAADLMDPAAKVCFKRLLLQPRGVLAFTRQDTNAMVHVGNSSSPAAPVEDQQDCAERALPSSLFQRWNLHARSGLGSLPTPYAAPSKVLKVLVIVRSQSSKYHRNADHFLTRIIVNQQEVIAALQAGLRGTSSAQVVVEAVDQLSLPFDAQLQQIASAGVVIGMHSSAMALAVMGMSLGNGLCCGLLEVFPAGPATGKQGYAHLARDMGHQYERFDLLPAEGNTTAVGSVVPADLLVDTAARIVQRILGGQASCLLPEVAKSPFF